MLSTPAQEYNEFPAALSFLPNLTQPDAINALTARIARLEEQLAALDAEITDVTSFLARLFAIESEYKHQVVAAELSYVRGLIEDLRAKRITWPQSVP
jgi:hypothetical protein